MLLSYHNQQHLESSFAGYRMRQIGGHYYQLTGFYGLLAACYSYYRRAVNNLQGSVERRSMLAEALAGIERKQSYIAYALIEQGFTHY